MKIYNPPFLRLFLLIFGIVLISSKTNFCQAQNWTTSGNAITGSNFLGTTNNEPLVFKANSHVAMVILGNGNVGIGTSDPNYPFQINGDMVDSGTIYTTNLEISNNLSIGQFKMVHGVIDSIISTSGNLQLSATVVNSDGSITAAQMVTAGNGDSAITLDGNAGTITSMTQTVSFGNDTITSKSALKSPQVVFESSSLSPAGAASISLWPSALGTANTPPPTEGEDCHCNSPATPLTFRSCGFIFGSIPPLLINGATPLYNTFMGIGTASPDAGLSISTYCPIEFSVIPPGSTTDVFNIDENGDTYIAGNTGIGTITPDAQLNISVPPVISTLPPLTITNPSAPSSPYLWVANQNSGTLTGVNGVVGIGTNNPEATLEVKQLNPAWGLLFQVTNEWPKAVFQVGQDGYTYVAGQLVIVGGEIYSDPPANDYGLTVGGVNAGDGGTILCTELKVCLSGCDFVFDKDYKLLSLDSLESYLELNHHLPGIPSAKDMTSSDGVGLGKTTSQLLQKVEELTLYTIQLKKQLDEMQAEIVKMKESK